MYYRAIIASSAAVFLASVWLDIAVLVLAWFLLCVPGLMAYRLFRRRPRDSRGITYEEYRRLPESGREEKACMRLCKRLKSGRGYSDGRRYCPYCKVYMRIVSSDCPCCSAPLRTGTNA